MANGAFKFKDNSGNVVSFISGSGSNISFSGGTLDLSGMTGLTLGNLTLSGTTQNALSASHAASYLLTSSFNTYSGTTDTVIGTLQTSTSSLNSFTSSATTRLNSIETSTGSLNSYTSSNNTKLGVIESTTGSLNSYTSSNTTNINAIHTSTGSLNTFTSSATTRLNSIEGVSGSYATTGSNQFKNDQVITGSLTVTGFIDAQELRTTYISSSILYRSGSTKFGDELSDTHSFTGSLLVSGTISVPGSGLISGSSQLPSGIISGSSQLPSGLVSGSAQVISLLPSGIVSGSVQVDVMSTTNIARLATTGSNVFTGAITGTTATLSGAITSKDVYITNSANADVLEIFQSPSVLNSFIDYPSGRSLILRNKGTAGGLTLASTGAATFSSAATNGVSIVNTTSAAALISFSNTANGHSFGFSSTGTGGQRFSFINGAPTEIAYITSAGAATFLGDTLTLGSAVAATNVNLNINGVANRAARIQFQQSGVNSWLLGNGAASEDNNFELYNSSGTMAMKINKTSNAINFVGATTFSSSVTAGTFLGVSRDGSNTIGSGPYLVLSQTANSRQWVQQMDASLALNFYHYNGSAWIQPLTLTATGVATFTNLSGTGTRKVLADSSGNLSAPQTDTSYTISLAGITAGSWFTITSHNFSGFNGLVSLQIQNLIPSYGYFVSASAWIFQQGHNGDPTYGTLRGVTIRPDGVSYEGYNVVESYHTAPTSGRYNMRMKLIVRDAGLSAANPINLQIWVDNTTGITSGSTTLSVRGF